MKIRFHTQTCGRCGGGGRYSYCQMYGDTCFDCAGKGKVLTKAARIASAKLAAFAKSDPSVTARVGDLKVGDVIMGHDSGLTVGGQLFHKRPRPVTLTEVDVDAEHNRVHLGWMEPELRKGPLIKTGLTTDPDARRPLPLSGARWDAYVAFARTLGKGLYFTTDDGNFLEGDDPKAAEAKREADREKRRIASEKRRDRQRAAAADADVKAMIELDRAVRGTELRALLAAVPHPKIKGKSALDYAEWLSANLTPTMAMAKLRPILDAAATVSREDL